MQQHLEALAILGDVDGVGAGPEQRNACGGQRLRQLQRRLAAVLHDAAEHGAALLLAADQRNDILIRERLEVQPVRGVVVGADGFRVAVDHDGLEPGFLQRIGRVDAAIVEFDALADAVGSAPEDDDLLSVGGVALADGSGEARLVGRVHIRCGEGNSAAQVSMRL